MANTINEPQRKRHQDGQGYRDEGVDACPGNRSRVAGIIGIEENYAEDSLPQRVSYISRTQQATRGVYTDKRSWKEESGENVDVVHCRRVALRLPGNVGGKPIEVL